MRELTEVGGAYGAQMGRQDSVVDRDFPVEFEVQRLQWVDDDYDQGGAYWGRQFEDPRSRSGSDFIFWFEGESADDVETMFVRAKNMNDAKAAVLETYANATFSSSADLESVYSGYVDAALWSSTNDRHYENPEEPEMLDDADYDLSEELETHFRADCQAFLDKHADLVAAVMEAGMDGENIGHNFWLTRNGHGVGFDDRGHGELGEQLHAAAKEFGEDDLYVGDDDKIHSMYEHRHATPAEAGQVISPTMP